MAERRVADQQTVDDLPGHHQPVAAVGVGGIGLPPAPWSGTRHSTFPSSPKLASSSMLPGWSRG